MLHFDQSNCYSSLQVICNSSVGVFLCGFSFNPTYYLFHIHYMYARLQPTYDTIKTKILRHPHSSAYPSSLFSILKKRTCLRLEVVGRFTLCYKPPQCVLKIKIWWSKLNHIIYKNICQSWNLQTRHSEIMSKSNTYLKHVWLYVENTDTALTLVIQGPSGS